MSYNNFSPVNGGLGMPGAGFASRGKATGLKRLSVASPPTVGPINENQVDNGTPRTSRSHLLAGLRTAQRTQAVPASAPYQQQHFGYDASKYANQYNLGYNQGVPHTAIGSGFPANAQQYGMSAGQQVYALPEQVLAPPTINYQDETEDPELSARLMAMQLHLAQRQQQLQQQLLQATLQQMHGMTVNNSAGMRHGSVPQTPATPHTNYYAQQLQNGVSPITQELPNQPGVFLVYNPLTGQYSYHVDQSAQQSQLANSPPPPTPGHAQYHFNMETPTFRAEVSPPLERDNASPFGNRSISPPKKSPSPPTDVTPLPPPSANAFRRGHKKAVSSLAFNTPANNSVEGGPRSALTRPVGFPQTPMTGTFGPGQARAGEHPVRQPRGPPNLEELVAAPTTKHEGSKNFATRQRRRAVHSLVRAGLERRVVRNGSAGSMTPVSEADMNFSLPSDNDSDSGRSGSGSGSLSGKASIGGLRAAVNGAIGSERKQMQQGSMERMGSSELIGLGSTFVSPIQEKDGFDVKVEEVGRPVPGNRRKTPLLVLTNAAEKRMSSMF